MTTPQAVWSGEFKIGRVVLHAYVLDNGERVVDAEDIARLFSSDLDPDDRVDMDAFARWLRGDE